jgi:hypothetical protein
VGQGAAADSKAGFSEQREAFMQPRTQPAPAEAPNWPIIDNVIGPLADWWRRHASVEDNLAKLNELGPDEMARMAQDVGVSPADLRALASHCSDAANLLEQRLGALGLTADELRRAAPNELRDMERLCTMCASKGRCARDLAADPDDPVWRKYCPNEQSLIALARAGIER